MSGRDGDGAVSRQRLTAECATVGKYGDQGVDPRVIREVKIDNGHLYQWKLAAILRLQRIAPRNSHLASFQYHWHYLEVY